MSALNVYFMKVNTVRYLNNMLSIREGSIIAVLYVNSLVKMIRLN